MTVGERPDPRSCGTRDGMRVALPPDVVARICNRPTTTQGGRSMNFIIWLIVGGLIGWLASIVMRHPEGVLMDVVVGIVGAVLAGFLLSPVFGVSTINQSNFSPASLLVSLLGSVILLAIVTLSPRGAVR